MAIDLETAVRQGIISNSDTNEKRIEAYNLEVTFDDANGIFKIIDGADETVATIDAEGNLKIDGYAEVDGGNVQVTGTTNTALFTMLDGVDESSIYLLDADPNGSVVGTKGSLGLDYGDGYAYINVDDNTSWERLAFYSEVTESEEDGTFTQKRTLDINGAILNGVVRVNNDNLTPSLDFRRLFTSRASWSIPVPADWDGTSDITVTGIWSPSNNDTGDVVWGLEYKVLALAELSNGAVTTDNYTQTADGTAFSVHTTGANLTIPAAAIDTSDAMIVINLTRDGSNAADTFNGVAQTHMVYYSYTANNTVV